MRKCFWGVGCCLLAASLALLASCSHKSTAGVTADNDDLKPVPMEVNTQNSRPHLMRAKATLFKMSGDYADNVAVTIGPDGNLSYFPAPTDLTDQSAPEEVGEGWWLNRQGLGPNSVFTKYTFSEYRALKTVPTPEEIKAAIIPGAHVTEFRQLVLPAEEARGLQPSELLKYLHEEEK